MSSELSESVRAAIAASFAPADRAQAEQWLVEECTEATVHWTAVDEVRAAIVAVSRGSLERLVDAIARARTDARDVMMQAQLSR